MQDDDDDDDDDNDDPTILNNRAKNRTSERTIVPWTVIFWFVSTVRFQMSPQIDCLRGCKVTLVAFVWLFSTVNFQMCPQMASSYCFSQIQIE